MLEKICREEIDAELNELPEICNGDCYLCYLCDKELIQVPKLEKKLSYLKLAIGLKLKSLHLLADRTGKNRNKSKQSVKIQDNFSSFLCRHS